MGTSEEEEEDLARRMEELEALKAFYGDDVAVGDEMNPGGGPWTLKIASSVDLEIELPARYPSMEAPIPRILAPSYVVDDLRRKKLEAKLTEMYQADTEVVIMWTEHIRTSIGDTEPLAEQEIDDENTDEQDDAQPDETLEGARIFHPNTSKYGQPIRPFSDAVILAESNRRDIHRGQPYHPPKSGAAETMVAHVASVESMDHVNWVLAELLLNDKKVAKATHNMIAYRFWDKERNCLVSDNDDDGEKGAGAKLAALLELADVQNAIVVVSRWYGGIHLGPSRFKYFASTARDALQEAGFIKK